jgi:hypothetical protein
MTEIRTEITSEFKEGNYAKVVELIQTDNLLELDYQFLLILALYKEDSKAAEIKLRKLIDNHGFGVLDIIFSTTSIGIIIKSELQKIIRNISLEFPNYYYGYSFDNIFQNFGLMVSSGLAIGAIGGPIGAVGGAIVGGAVGGVAKHLNRRELRLKKLLNSKEYCLGIGECHKFLSDYELSLKKIPSWLFSYLYIFNKNLGDNSMAHVYKRKYQERKLEEKPAIRAKFEKALAEIKEVFSEIQINEVLTFEDIESFSKLTNVEEGIPQYAQDTSNFNELLFQFPKKFSPKDRFPVTLINPNINIEIKLSQTLVSFLLFLAIERQANGYKWLESINNHLDELNSIFNRLDIIDRGKDSLNITDSTSKLNSLSPWILDESMTYRKSIVSKINKAVSMEVNGKLIISARSHLNGIYTLIPAIKKISFNPK